MAKTKTKNIFSFKILIILLVVLVIGINVLPPLFENAFSQAKHYYNFNINPKAQAIILEKEYKNTFDSNQKIFQESNQAVEDMVSEKETFYTVEQQLLVNFNERDSKYKQMIKIDNDSLSLNLPEAYKEFYKKRLEADKKDYEAFNVYRKGSEDYFQASSAFQSYGDVYQDFLKDFGELDVVNYSQDQVDDVRYMANLFQGSYENIAGIADTTDIFNQEILEYIQDEYDLFTYTKNYLDAFENKDESKMDQAFNGMISFLYNREKKDINEIINRWGEEKFGPVYQKQDALHFEANNLYQETYDFVRKQNLKDILSVWKLETPGTDMEISPNV